MDNTKPKKVIFVVMPFSKEYKNVYDFAIKSACSESSVLCERLDEQIFTKNMLSQIYTQLYKADFIIADMSERNPNVFYEVGYAHALDKNVILITNNSDDIPFDLTQLQHIIYDKNNLSALKEKLFERIQYFTKSIVDDKKNGTIDYSFSIDGETIDNNSSLVVEANYDDDDNIEFNLDIHNLTNKKIENTDTKIYLIVPKNWVSREYTTYPIIEKNSLSMDIGNLPDLLPQTHDSLRVTIDKNKREPEIYYNEYAKLIIRMVNKQTIVDKEVRIKFKKQN
jgi:hypothetical protein